MIHCKDCRYFEYRLDLSIFDGRCRIKLPSWITDELEDAGPKIQACNETDGCDLGQPKEENGE